MTERELCILWGHEQFADQKGKETRFLFRVSRYRSIPLTEIREVVIDRLYAGSARNMVAALVRADQLNQEDIAQLRQLLDEMDGERRQ